MLFEKWMGSFFIIIMKVGYIIILRPWRPLHNHINMRKRGVNVLKKKKKKNVYDVK